MRVDERDEIALGLCIEASCLHGDPELRKQACPQIGVALDDADRSVDLVRDARGELAQARQLLGLDESRLNSGERSVRSTSLELCGDP